MRAVLLGLLVAALGAGNADAQKNESANFMVPVCKKWLAGSGAKDAEGLQLIFDAGVCSGTISTLTHVRELVLPDFRSCWQQGATWGQSIRVALAYIEAHPERMHEDFRDLVLEAWHEAWPCK